ncbi:hypothetical protein L207DRAFT_132428 [Hyaloscypha variabilis F]|uniref:Uncharacterized protein n=1 Tax=Hyaloscypha variabilis (strain UAMH 11265 / GT02V1 / F) TaxID=1149755 RepID=A0A2J6R658_HYAVF|nr:hypothetical protein L207DRAFT_132428 [Hyaloscypha variabilis F]
MRKENMDAPARPPGLNASRPQFGGLGSRLPLSIQRSSNVRRIAVVFHSAEFPRRQNPRTPTRTLTLTLARTRTRSLAHSAPLSTAPPTAVQHRTPRRSDLIPLRTAGKTAVAPSASASFTSLPCPAGMLRLFSDSCCCHSRCQEHSVSVQSSDRGCGRFSSPSCSASASHNAPNEMKLAPNETSLCPMGPSLL